MRSYFGTRKLTILWLDKIDHDLLKEKGVELILAAPADFFDKLKKAEQGISADLPGLDIYLRPDDDHSKQARNRLAPLLENWRRQLVKVRFARQACPVPSMSRFASMNLACAHRWGRGGHRSIDGAHLPVHARHVVADRCSLSGRRFVRRGKRAGHDGNFAHHARRARGDRARQILYHLDLQRALGAAQLAEHGHHDLGIRAQYLQGSLPVAALLWCVLLSLPLSAMFSAISLAIGAYARSSKEGQYYLMPLFLITMPLIFLTLAPGVDLNPFYSLIPVTGVALLMQRLMTASSLADVPWLYFIPVFAPIAIYSWLTLKWAILQFQREEVLFREAERIDVRLWLRSLLREKEAMPTTGQAFFCFALLFCLRWLATAIGSDWDQTVQRLGHHAGVHADARALHGGHAQWRAARKACCCGGRHSRKSAWRVCWRCC